jgi:hypothetical protein
MLGVESLANAPFKLAAEPTQTGGKFAVTLFKVVFFFSARIFLIIEIIIDNRFIIIPLYRTLGFF